MYKRQWSGFQDKLHWDYISYMHRKSLKLSESNILNVTKKQYNLHRQPDKD